jgi:hypothetical protein
VTKKYKLISNRLSMDSVRHRYRSSSKGSKQRSKKKGVKILKLKVSRCKLDRYKLKKRNFKITSLKPCRAKVCHRRRKLRMCGSPKIIRSKQSSL